MEKQLHEGHRARLRQSAKQDEELTSFSEFQVLSISCPLSFRERTPTL